MREDQYYCLDDAVKYLQSRKAAQRKHCKLLYTHSKEEISAIIKHVNRRLDEDSDEDSDSDSDSEKITIRRVSELGKEEARKNRNTDSAPVSSPTPPAITPASHSGRPRLSAPNVPPGTSVNVSSFSLVRFYLCLIFEVFFYYLQLFAFSAASARKFIS